MENVKGLSLKQVARTFREEGRLLPIALSVDIIYRLAQVVYGLERANTSTHQYYVHGQLTPSSILLLPGGQIELAQMAGPWDPQPDFSMSQGTFESALSYFAPEQMILNDGDFDQGDPSDLPSPKGVATDVGPKADQFALALILTELLIGRPVYDAPTLTLMARQVEDAAVDASLARVKSNYTSAFTVLKQALNADCKNRFNTLLEFADALTRSIGAAPPEISIGKMVSLLKQNEPVPHLYGKSIPWERGPQKPTLRHQGKNQPSSNVPWEDETGSDLPPDPQGLTSGVATPSREGAFAIDPDEEAVITEAMATASTISAHHRGHIRPGQLATSADIDPSLPPEPLAIAQGKTAPQKPQSPEEEDALRAWEGATTVQFDRSLADKNPGLDAPDGFFVDSPSEAGLPPVPFIQPPDEGDGAGFRWALIAVALLCAFGLFYWQSQPTPSTVASLQQEGQATPKQVETPSPLMKAAAVAVPIKKTVPPPRSLTPTITPTPTGTAKPVEEAAPKPIKVAARPPESSRAAFVKRMNKPKKAVVLNKQKRTPSSSPVNLETKKAAVQSGLFSLRSIPQAASIKSKGVDLSAATRRRTPLNAGSHTLVVRDSTGREAHIDIHIRPNTWHRFVYNFEEKTLNEKGSAPVSTE